MKINKYQDGYLGGKNPKEEDILNLINNKSNILSSDDYMMDSNN